MTFVKNIQSPVLFVLGESDYRTPQDSGGEQLFRALKLLKRPTAMVAFHARLTSSRVQESLGIASSASMSS
jgi:dipeptidyl aminopeptidase/acylaminoacyl peptidase